MTVSGAPSELSNLGEFVFRFAGDKQIAILDTAASKEGLSSTSRAWTYEDLREASSAFAHGIVASGLAKPGDRLAVLAENCAEFIVLFSGSMLAGLTFVPVNYRLAPDTVGFILDDSRCSTIWIDDPARLPPGRNERLLSIHGSDQESLKAILAIGSKDSLHRPIETMASDPACILYTSGTTGQPKGVVLNHGGQIWALERTSPPFSDLAGSMTLMAAPYYHMNGLFISMNCLASGVGLAIMPRFDARSYLHLLTELKCPFLTGIPTMFAMIARETDLIPANGFPFVEHLILGSSPVSAKQLDQISRLFPKATMRNAFGTTEGGAYVFGPHPDRLATPAQSVGFPAADVEITLLGGAGPDIGTMHMRSPAVMSGYLNRPDLTAAKLNAGWYDTGDVMRRDKDGFYFHVGRSDDMFVCGGENIHPGEVEMVLERIDGVAQAAVVPVPDEIKNFVPVAFVVRNQGSALTEQDVKAHALANGPAFAHPRHVAFIDALPVAPSFKYDRAALVVTAHSMFGSNPTHTPANLGTEARSNTDA